jgi:SAM-dependent methyltransferase
MLYHGYPKRCPHRTDDGRREKALMAHREGAIMLTQDAPENPATLPPPVRMLQLIMGYAISQAIYVVAKLGIADCLKDGPMNAQMLATATGTHAASLHSVLRTLARVGVFREVEPDHFALTSLSELLQTDRDHSFRAVAIANGEPWHWRPWGEMLHSVTTGRPAFDHVFDTDLYHYLASNPADALCFSEGMAGFTATAALAVLAAYPFVGSGTVVDVGGGHGALLAAILRATPDVRGILFDQPAVIEGAGRYLEVAGVADRCERIAGDFFASLPSGGDVYLLKNVIHDWDDDRARTILRNCQRVMRADGKLLVIEKVVSRTQTSLFDHLLDLEMLLITPAGLERTAAAYQSLFETAGLRLTRFVPTLTPMLSVIEGVRVSDRPIPDV